MLFIKILKKAPETLSRNEGCVLLPQTPASSTPLLPALPPPAAGWIVGGITPLGRCEPAHPH